MEFMEATLNEQSESAALGELKKHRRDNRKPFFLWKLQFIEVFQDKGGFDVIVANPPYIRQERDQRDQASTQANLFELYGYCGSLCLLLREIVAAAGAKRGHGVDLI
jgi:hypothetical protein